MKTIFNRSDREELITRIAFLNENSTARWGRMNICQMLKHCTVWDEWVQGRNGVTYKQALIGVVFGKVALGRMIRDARHFDQNVPTSKQFVIREKTCDVNAEKLKWQNLIRAYEQFSNPAFVHDFFGKMTEEQIGILAYKHTDHHLRQFNA